MQLTNYDPGHYVKLASKLAKRLGIARAHARDANRRVEALREIAEDLRTQVDALREANRRLNELLDRREAPRPSTIDSGFPAGTIGW